MRWASLARGANGVAAAKARLIARTRIEKEPRVWGAVAATLGRLAYTTAPDVQQVETILAASPHPGDHGASIDALLGAVEGLEALARQSGKVSPLSGTTLNGLRAASELEGRAQDAAKLTRIRRLATLALTAAGAVNATAARGGNRGPRRRSAAFDDDCCACGNRWSRGSRRERSRRCQPSRSLRSPPDMGSPAPEDIMPPGTKRPFAIRIRTSRCSPSICWATAARPTNPRPARCRRWRKG